jgi:glycosyltransferase involved in cell wall biosynthesis
MQITLLVSNDIQYDQRMIRIATSLQKEGYQIILVGRQKKTKIIPSYSFKTHLLSNYFSSGVLFYLEFNLRLFLYLCSRKREVIYAVDFDTLPATFLYHIIYSKPFVFDSHELFTEVPELQNHKIKKWIWEMVGKYTIPSATFSMTVSESLAHYLSVKYGVNFVTIRNVPLKKSIETIDIDERRKNKWIYYQGMLHQGRGIDFLIKSMVELPTWTLILAGDGDTSEELKTLSKELGLEKQVIFKGMIQPEDLIDIAKNAWIGINLLENNSLSYYYSLANKTFDYFQARIPAIHIDFPEYRLLARENESIYLLEKIETADFVAIIKNIWENESLYKNMVQASEQAAEKYVWENEEEKLIAEFATYFPLLRDNLQR